MVTMPNSQPSLSILILRLLVVEENMILYIAEL